MSEKIDAGDLSYEEAPVVELSFNDSPYGHVLYKGQKPQREKSFIGRLETGYGVKEGTFVFSEDEPG